MGQFIYDNRVKVEIEDRALAHLRTVICDKLRRGERFLFTWPDDQSLGGGRTSVWVTPPSSLVFKFHGSRPPRLNRNWLAVLAAAANTPAGLHMLAEPETAPEPLPNGAHR